MSAHRPQGGKSNLHRAIARALQIAESTPDDRLALDAIRVFNALRAKPRPATDELADVMSKRKQTTCKTPEPDTDRLAEAKKLLE